MELKEKLKVIVRSNGILETISEVVITDSGAIGEGFTTLTQLVTVKFENPDRKDLNWFIKVPLKSDSVSKVVDEGKSFEKETRFLVDYVQAAKNFCEEKGHADFVDFYPNCYYGDDGLIVLENLVMEKGYKLIKLDVRHDLETAKWALETLAKHHALGYVMIQENGGPENFFKIFPNLDFECFDKPGFIEAMEPQFDTCINTNVKILQASGIPGADITANKYKKFLGFGMKLLLDDLDKPSDEKLKVLGHGDYWANNMMYLMDNETGKIKHHVAIDFQTSRYNSAALDLGNYLFTSVQPKIRKDHLQELLEFYKMTFNDVTQKLGHPVNLTLDQVFLEYRKKFGHGFWNGFTLAIGPMMSIYRTVDMTKVELKDWARVISELSDKWIEENPGEIEEVAEELIMWMDEYERLRVV